MNGLKALPFLREKGHVVSLVGGGGKTTLLYGMARLCAAEGQRVLVSTTTHIQRPSANYAPDEAARDALWQAGTYAVAGSLAENGKLTRRRPVRMDGRGRYRPSRSRRREASPLQGPRRPMSPVLLPKATSCWPWPGCRLWAGPSRRSASGWMRPAPCWACRPKPL